MCPDLMASASHYALTRKVINLFQLVVVASRVCIVMSHAIATSYHCYQMAADGSEPCFGD